MVRQVCPVVLIGAVLLALAGCGPSHPSETIVRGQILYRGHPLGGGVIVFTPNADRGSDGPPLMAVLEPDGSFNLTAENGQPLPAGWYRVSVAPRAGTISPPSAERPYPGISAKFRNPALSGLEHEVKEGVDNVICFDLDDS